MKVFQGNILKENSEPLSEISWEGIVLRIKEEKWLKDQINRLREVNKMDSKAYAKLKTQLPYFITAKFDEGKRHGTKFKEIYGMVIDLDHLEKDSRSLDEMKTEISNDPNLLMAYISPSGKGLKLYFPFDKPIKSPKQYSEFYKVFCGHVSDKYDLGAYVDFTTCDVTRVSFLSHDPRLYFNESAEPLRLSEYIDTLFQEEQTKIDQDGFEAHKEVQENKSHNIEPSTYRQILAELGTKSRLRKKHIFVPEGMEKVVSPIRKSLEPFNIKIDEVREIHYGLKLICRSGLDWAELNVFYGKRGYSVVITPKRGTHPELSELCQRIMERVVYGSGWDCVQSGSTNLRVLK